MTRLATRMFGLRGGRGRRWAVLRLVLVQLAVGAVVAWVLALRHNAWGANARWPQYACIHRGRAMVFSSVWHAAWRFEPWMYDCVGPREDWVLPRYARIGDTYGGTRAYVTSLYALSVPLWNFALPAGLGAWWAHGRVRRARALALGECPVCGYSLAGLGASVATCPECGGNCGARRRARARNRARGYGEDHKLVPGRRKQPPKVAEFEARLAK